MALSAVANTTAFRRGLTVWMCSRCARTTSTEESFLAAMARANHPAGAPITSRKLVPGGEISRWEANSNSLDGVAGLDVQHLHAVPKEFLKLVGTTAEDGERAEVHRHHGLHAEELGRLGGALRAHGVEAADRQKCDVELRQLGEQRHVAEDVGVAGEVDLEPVLELDHKAACVAPVDDVAAVLGDAARVLGVDKGDLDAVDVDCAALVGADDLVSFQTLRAEPRADLEVADNRRLGAARYLERVMDVVEMAVRDEHQVAFVHGLQRFRGDGVVHHPRVDEDLLAFCAARLPCTVTDPREADVSVERHSLCPPFTTRS